ncbi:Gfo/Idh/MocA family protein [Arthrobacter sp. 4R501]|uniref:Gfo/Idh/MocA family protein n=1 Tax=Arthrobacter sp. 4R501 TaxID=2058886 RepID=UPI000CE395A2|nr:Gfo/Idh/MocA family oxidoreductase [Arthrobacter sp. 4R501]
MKDESRLPEVTLVGTSGYGRRHLESLLGWHAQGLIRLSGLVDLRFADETRQALAASQAEPGWFGSVEESFAGGLPDVVVVATPPQTHFDVANSVLKRGVGLYLEKPPVPLLQQLDELAALQTSRRFEIGFQETRRCVETLQTVLASREIGEVHRITAHAALERPDAYYQRSGWAGKWFSDGLPVLDGPLFNPLAHILHTALSFAKCVDGRWAPQTVDAEFYSVRAIEGDDLGALRVRSNYGPEVVAVGTTAADSVREPAVTLHGSKGTATIRHRDGFCLVSTGQAPVSFPVTGQVAALYDAVTNPEGSADELIDAAAVRPFVMVVNASVEAAHAPARLSHLQAKRLHEGRTFRYFPGIAEHIDTVTETGLLFSELGLDWARPGGSLDLTEYSGLHHPLMTAIATPAGHPTCSGRSLYDDDKGLSQVGRT